VRHAFRLPEPGSPEVEVDNNQFTGFRVWIDGVRQPRLRVRGRPTWAIPMAGGTTRRVTFAGAMTGLRAIVDDDQVIELERRFSLWELVLALAPISLVGFTGVAGGVCGVLAIVANLRLLRMPWPTPVRIAAALGTFALAAAVSYPIALALFA
jgi:hypothetical protein